MDQELLTMTEACRRLNVTRTVLSRRVRSGRLPAYVNPRDRRQTLLKAEDLAEFRPDQPLRRKEVAVA